MFQSRAQLAAENLFLRKQLACYVERQVRPRRTHNASRIALVLLSPFVDWRQLLTILQPDTLVRWHRDLFHLFWRLKSRQRGRPRIPIEVQRLIAEMATHNRTWGEGARGGAPREAWSDGVATYRAPLHAATAEESWWSIDHGTSLAADARALLAHPSQCEEGRARSVGRGFEAPCRNEAPQQPVTAGRRGHGISWSERSRSCSKSLDREFFGLKRATQAFADAP